MNSNCWGGDHAAIHVENRVVALARGDAGLPAEAEGILVSGGSMANFTALAAARRAMAPGNVREEGLPRRSLRSSCTPPTRSTPASTRRWTCSASGRNQLRKIATDERFRIRLDLLAERRRAGPPGRACAPRSSSATPAPSTPERSIRSQELADFCRRESLWFHVDGAYGAMAAISPTLAPLFAGMERADSIAADPHKWLYVPYEAGATLVREPGRLGAAFRKFPEYLAADADSPFPGPAWFAERGVELSRGFKALKVWMGLKTHGRRGYAAAIENDVRLARFLAGEVDRRPDFERLADSVLSIANFRYRPAGPVALGRGARPRSTAGSSTASSATARSSSRRRSSRGARPCASPSSTSARGRRT